MFSVVFHTALIVVVVGREEPRPEVQSGEIENVSYLIPFDRIKAPPPLAVPTRWHGIGLVGEGTGFDLGLTEADAPTGPPGSGRENSANATTAREVQGIVFDSVATAIDGTRSTASSKVSLPRIHRLCGQEHRGQRSCSSSSTRWDGSIPCHSR